METIAVIDFETTGLYPGVGGRATEIAVVLVRDGLIVDCYASLMNAGVWISPFITQLTGITNEMVRSAPPAERIMREAAAFVGGHPLVAHNAAFDRGFWEAEMARVRISHRREFACSMLLSRRVFPEAPSHSLGAIAEHVGLPSAGRAHRALADATVAAHLVLRMGEELRRRFSLEEVPHDLLRLLQRTPKDRLDRTVERYLTGPRRR